MESILNKPPNGIWLKAAVVGSVWASIEIILGSFLHNLKIPISGMILSIISVYLMIAVLQVWKVNGMIWRAGIICALMKSISPSAIILGPMTGILLEALLVELFIFLLGRNLIGYLIGGALAVLSTILHKLVSLLIIYGFDFMKILDALYQFSLKQIHIENLSPIYLIWVITFIYIATGMAAAVGGYRAGLRYKRTNGAMTGESPIQLDWNNKLFNLDSKQNYSLVALILNLAAMVVVLFFLNSKMIWVPALLAAAYAIFCIVLYKRSLNRLKKWSFWLSFIVITLTTTFLWNGISKGTFFSMDGLIAGIRMNVRAIIMILGFNAVSVELKNPLIRSVLYRGGFGSLYQSLNLAFSALPYLISNLSLREKGKRLSGLSFSVLFRDANALLKAFETEHLYRPRIIIVTGDVHQGKTTFAKEVVSRLKTDGIRVAGFLAVGVQENGERIGFELVNIETSDQVKLCSKTGDETSIRHGHYFFNPDAVKNGEQILDPANMLDKQLIVIDEIGPLELSGRGWSDAIDKLTRNRPVPQLWVVRKALVRRVSRKWNVGDVFIFDIGKSKPEEVAEKIQEILAENQGLK